MYHILKFLGQSTVGGCSGTHTTVGGFGPVKKKKMRYVCLFVSVYNEKQQLRMSIFRNSHVSMMTFNEKPPLKIIFWM